LDEMLTVKGCCKLHPTHHEHEDIGRDADSEGLLQTNGLKHSTVEESRAHTWLGPAIDTKSHDCLSNDHTHSK